MITKSIKAAVAPHLLWIKPAVLALLVGVIWWQVTAYGGRQYAAGESAKQAEWNKAVERGRAELERLRAAAAKVTTRTVTEYVDRVQVIKEKGDAIVREVPVFVPAGSCDLPGGFRLLHDAAAVAGPVPDPARAADAAAVPAQDATRTVAGNYGACHETGQRLISLQSWVREQCRANPPAEGCP